MAIEAANTRKAHAEKIQETHTENMTKIHDVIVATVASTYVYANTLFNQSLVQPPG